MTFSENILVSYQTPNAESLYSPFFYRPNFGIWNKVFYGSSQYHRLMGAHYAGVLYCLLWKWKFKIARNWDRQNISGDSDADIASGSIPSIYEIWSRFKFKIVLSRPFPFLKEVDVADSNRKVRSNDGSVPGSYGGGDGFHCIGGSGSFSNVAFHSGGLLASGFDGPPELNRLVTVYSQLQNGHNGEYRRKINNIPVVFRFIFSIFCVLCGFFWSLYGWDYLYDHRRFLGTALICGGSLLGLLGFSVWLL